MWQLWDDIVEYYMYTAQLNFEKSYASDYFVTLKNSTSTYVLKTYVSMSNL